MGGRFGKYGDAKRKARLRKSRLRPAHLQQQAKEQASKTVRKTDKGPKDQKAGP